MDTTVGALMVFLLRLVLAGCLYAFLGWSVYTIWRELRLQGGSVGDRPVPALSIQPHAGSELPSRRFTATKLLIGRDTTCDYPAPHNTVSSRHARLSFHHNQWWVEDLQSTNGTFLNDERVYTPTVVISGDELRCGKLPLQIIIGEETARGDMQEFVL